MFRTDIPTGVDEDTRRHVAAAARQVEARERSGSLKERPRSLPAWGAGGNTGTMGQMDVPTATGSWRRHGAHVSAYARVPMAIDTCA